MRIHALSLIILVAVPGSAVADSGSAAAAAPRRAKQTLTVSSSAFRANEAIPAEYTCDGAQVAPPLAWSAPPKDTRSIAVFIDDPDAPSKTFTHWLVTGIPPTARSLAVGGALPDGAIASKNGKGDIGYVGPCPPTGNHHYHFHVYALENTIPPPGGKDEFLAAIDGHILAEGQLVATYRKVTAGKPSDPK
jgi:Raf kinase inhibitor-like YbhB/YbcL family protein